MHTTKTDIVTKSGIYQIRNLINNKVYVGSTKSFNVRFKTHKYLLNNNKHINKHLQNAWNKYGEDNFIFEVIEECNTEALQEKEQCWLDKTLSYNQSNGYNILPNAYSNKGHSPSEDTRNKMRIAKIGFVFTDEHRRKISKANLGKRMSTKLSEHEVKIIRIILRDTDLSHTEVGELFNIHLSNIGYIANNKTWTDIVINENDKLEESIAVKIEEIQRKRKVIKNNKKLTYEEVKTIKLLLRDTSLYHHEIASLFDVGRKAITKINMNQRWSDVIIKDDDELDNLYLQLATEIIERR